MKLIFASLFAAAAYAADPCDDCEATCNDDQSITISIPYDREAAVLSLDYGNCNKSADGVRIEQNTTTNEFTITLQMADCDMDSTLRTIDYDQSVTDIRIGVDSQGQELEFSRFQFNTWCSYDDTYEVEFNYGTLSSDVQEFNETGGNIGYAFTISACVTSSCNSYISSSADQPAKGGDLIYLGLYTTSAHWDADTKKFAPINCTISDTTNDIDYVLFDSESSDSCHNDDVGLYMWYNNTASRWEFNHILFLLGSYESSTFSLKCNIVVCDYDSSSSQCNDVMDNCCDGCEWEYTD